MPELTTFVATCRVVGMTSDDADAIHTALAATTARMTAAGGRVRFLRSGFLPHTHQWFGVLAAEDPDVVHRIARIAQLSSVQVERVVEFGARCGGDSMNVVERSGS